MKAGANKFVARMGAVAAAAASAFAVPSFAFAAERETTGIGAILPQMDEFIPMLVAFIVIAIILGKFGWPAFDNVLKKREATIRESLEKSEAARIESERVLEEYKAELADAKKQAAEILADAKKAGEAVKAEIEASAQKQAEDIIAKAKVAIEQERKQAVAQLQSSVADLSVSVAGKLIGEDLTDAEHRKVIERYVEEAGSLNAN